MAKMAKSKTSVNPSLLMSPMQTVGGAWVVKSREGGVLAVSPPSLWAKTRQ